MFRAAACAAALACLALPAAAQDRPLVDHFATAFIGLHAGYHAPGSDGLVPVAQVAPGVFEVAGRRQATTTITEIEPCVFRYEARLGTRTPDPFDFHMERLVTLAYRPGRTGENGMTLQFFELQHDPGFVLRNGESIDTGLLLHDIDTDIPVDILDASVAALTQACPHDAALPSPPASTPF